MQYFNFVSRELKLFVLFLLMYLRYQYRVRYCLVFQISYVL